MYVFLIYHAFGARSSAPRLVFSALVASPLKLCAVTAPAIIPRFKDRSRDLRYAPLT